MPPTSGVSRPACIPRCVNGRAGSYPLGENGGGRMLPAKYRRSPRPGRTGKGRVFRREPAPDLRIAAQAPAGQTPRSTPAHRRVCRGEGAAAAVGANPHQACPKAVTAKTGLSAISALPPARTQTDPARRPGPSPRRPGSLHPRAGLPVPRSLRSHMRRGASPRPRQGKSGKARGRPPFPAFPRRVAPDDTGSRPARCGNLCRRRTTRVSLISGERPALGRRNPALRQALPSRARRQGPRFQAGPVPAAGYRLVAAPSPKAAGPTAVRRGGLLVQGRPP